MYELANGNSRYLYLTPTALNKANSIAISYLIYEIGDVLGFGEKCVGGYAVARYVVSGCGGTEGAQPLRAAAHKGAVSSFFGIFLSQHTKKATILGRFNQYRYFVGLSLLQG